MDGVLHTYTLFVKNPVVYCLLLYVKYLCIMLAYDYIIELFSPRYKEILMKEVHSISKKGRENHILSMTDDELAELEKKVERDLKTLDKALDEIDDYVEKKSKSFEEMNEYLTEEVSETFDEFIKPIEKPIEAFQETNKALNELIVSSEEIKETLEDMSKSLNGERVPNSVTKRERVPNSVTKRERECPIV
jgi:methyl-accepting chemotaxis protein